MMTNFSAIQKVAVLVAGSWGTALAQVLARHVPEVALYSRDSEVVQSMTEFRQNSKYLKGVELLPAIQPTNDMVQALTEAGAVILAVPSTAMRSIAAQIKPLLRADTIIIHAAKGFEADSLKRMSEVIAEELGQPFEEQIVVLSGPSHAEEVVHGLPTTVVVAAKHEHIAKIAQDLLSEPRFRVYTNTDVAGLEIAGALKNIVAIGAGIADGLHFGDNAKAALITRGLAEMTRLGVAMGAKPATFAGLAGIGDLVVTCTSKHSRNWRAGYQIGQGKALRDVLQEMGMVVEGVKSTFAAQQLAKRFGVDMPITSELYLIMAENKSPRDAVYDLMTREKNEERHLGD